jgi:DNA repair exonuclease SbcCD ATPase subunit
MSIELFMSLLRNVLIGSLIFSTAHAHDLPESHYDLMPEILELGEELESQWEEIQYDPQDPSTWVQYGFWPKNRGKIIGTVLLPGVGSIIGHQIDIADERAQRAENDRKRQLEEAEKARQDAEIRAAEAARQRAEEALQHQLEMQRIEGERRAEREAALIREQELLEQMALELKKVPEHVKDFIAALGQAYMMQIRNASSLEEKDRIFEKFLEAIQYNLDKFEA